MTIDIKVDRSVIIAQKKSLFCKKKLNLFYFCFVKVTFHIFIEFTLKNSITKFK